MSPAGALVLHLWHWMGIAAMIVAVPVGAASSRVTDEASAVAAAKKYTRGRCTMETSCEFKARREGKQWNVLVRFSDRTRPGAKAQPSGHLLLYFNEEGELVKRVERE